MENLKKNASNDALHDMDFFSTEELYLMILCLAKIFHGKLPSHCWASKAVLLFYLPAALHWSRLTSHRDNKLFFL